MTDNVASSSAAASSTVETVGVPADSSRPALTTSFKDYTVSETLLLLILLSILVIAVIKFIKGVF